MLEKTVNSFLSELDESKLLDSFCLLDGKKTLSQSTFLATVQAIHGEYSQAKHKLPLVVDIDHESLWEQLNIVNRPMIRSLERSVLRLIKTTTESNDRANEKEKASAQPLRKNDKRRQIGEEVKEIQEENDGIDEDEEIAAEEDADDSDSDSDNDNDGGNEEGEDGLSVEEEEEEEDMGDGDGSGVGSNGSEEGDMEAWLDEAEAMDEKEERRVAKELQQQQQQRARGGERDEEEDEEQEQEEGEGQLEDDGDLLEGVQHALYDSDSDLDGPETGPGPAAGNYKFDDFFKTEQRLGKPDRTRRKRVAFDDEQELEEDDGDDGEEVELEGSGPGRTAAGQQRRDPKKASSKSQRGAAALRAQISGLESFLLQDKPWELRGEVAARDRPQDSLLELAADIER